jgi:hypothetical protein
MGKNKSRSNGNQGIGQYAQWRLIVSQQRKIAYDTLNKLLSDNDYCPQSTLYWSIQCCYENDLINYEAKTLLEMINENGKIARHEWTTLAEQVMLSEHIVYIDSIFDNTSYKQNMCDPSFADEAIQILTHRDLIHILRDNDLSEESGFMECLNKAKEYELISNEQYERAKEVNKKGNTSKHYKKNKK